MQASRHWGFFNGTNLRPLLTDPQNIMSEEIKAMERWDYNDLNVQYLLFQQLPDSSAVRVGLIPTAWLSWDRVQDEFVAKSIYT